MDSGKVLLTSNYQTPQQTITFTKTINMYLHGTVCVLLQSVSILLVNNKTKDSILLSP